jgi:two-component system, NtrC family, sensor kinase
LTGTLRKNRNMRIVRLARMLSFHLFLLLLGVLLVVFIIYTYVNIRTQTTHLMSTVMEHANSTGDLIQRSTRYSMLLNRREDVYQIIKALGDQPGVEGIRIYNKKGDIMFSTNSSEIKTMVDMSAEACNICHVGNGPIESPTGTLRSRVFNSNNGHRVLGIIHPIRNEPDCYTAECHYHSANQTVLGVLDVKMSLATVDSQIQESKNGMMFTAGLAIFFTALLSGLFIYRVVQIPVHQLTIGTQQIAEGNLDYHLDIQSDDEIGLLAKSFNSMTGELKKARDEITDWSNTLEKKVQDKSEELQRAQYHLIQIEKMASLGKLSATVAHELNNPLAGILNYTKLNIRRLNKENLTKEELQNITKDLSFMAEEVSRCGNIVRNLLLFSKKQVTEFAAQSLDKILEKSCKLVAHHLQMRNVKLEKQVGDPCYELVCDGQAIQQVFIALFINAVEAMPQGGTLSVTTKPSPNKEDVEITVRDTGVGIPEKDVEHIFEPFFSTKENGKGVGLGLSIVYGIIRQHHGEITVESKPGKGTTFNIVLPRNFQKKESSDTKDKL